MQSSLFVAGASVLVAFAIGATGCKREAPRTSTTTTTGANVAAPGVTSHPAEGITSNGGVNADDIVRISDARCQRDARCGAVGAGQRYTDQDRCMMERREQTNSELAAQACPQGIDEDHIAACTDALKASPCDRSIEVLATVQACRASAVCRRVIRP